MNILLTGNNKKNDFYSTLDNVCEHLTNNSRKIKIYIDRYVKNNIKKYNYYSINSKSIHYDMVICIGGDGSILSAVRRMGANQIPILGIHIGNLGFLNQCNKNNYKKRINNVLRQRKIKYNCFILLESKFESKKHLNTTIYSLNDIVVTQSKISRLINLFAFNKDVLINEFSCDGLIVSTPLGSTGYSLSAGGPIVSQDVRSFIITPISPHRLSSSPIVINSDAVLEIKFSKQYKDLYISSDGQESFELANNTTIKIKKSKYYAKFVELVGANDYYLNLRDKLGW